MFSMFSHPATEFTCRHCRKPAGHDPEMCYHCGPICDNCFISDDPMDCPYERKLASKNKNESDQNHPSN